VVSVVQRLLAVQAQDGRGVRLAVRARSNGLRARDIDSSLGDRSVVITWLNRGTLHLVRSVDYWWLHALTTPPLFAVNARRLGQEGVPPGDAERGVAAIRRALAGGPLTRRELGERVASAGVRTGGQALIHVLALASLRGLIVRGPVLGRQHAFVLTRDWLGPPPSVDHARSLAELARRYLAGHGPATDRDLARWAGLPLAAARAGLNAIAAEIEERGRGQIVLGGRNRAARLPPPRLLGAFEPLLLGWESREQVLGGHASRVMTGGMFKPFALARGKAVATWRLDGGRVVIDPFTTLTSDVAAALAADSSDVIRFLS
jgi:hypothetical protein